MAKIHFTKLDNPFKLIFGDFKLHLKYFLPVTFLSTLFYILALTPKYFEQYVAFYPIPILIFSLVCTFVFCVFFWKYILKTLGLALIAYSKIKGEEIDLAEIDKKIKSKTKPIILFFSFGAVVALVATAFYLLLTFFALRLNTVLFDGPFLAISNFFFKNNIALLILSLAFLLGFAYFLARYFGLAIQVFLFEEESAIKPYKLSWSMLNRNVFAISFPIVVLTLLSYIPVFIIFVLISFLFSFNVPNFIALLADTLNYTIFQFLSTLFTVYILTSAYIKAKE